MKISLSMLLAVCLMTLSGCANVSAQADKSVSAKPLQVSGRYLNAMTSEIYVEFKADGTFVDRFGSRSVSGTYVMDGNRVILTPKGGKVFEYTVDGNSIVSKDGGRLTRK